MELEEAFRPRPPIEDGACLVCDRPATLHICDPAYSGLSFCSWAHLINRVTGMNFGELVDLLDKNQQIIWEDGRRTTIPCYETREATGQRVWAP